MQGNLSVERMCYLAQVSRAASTDLWPSGGQRKKRWKCGPPFSRSHWNIGAGTATGGSRRNCDVVECALIVNVYRGSCEKIIFWPCNRGRSWSPQIPSTSWRSI